jgi:hypothetical protein
MNKLTTLPLPLIAKIAIAMTFINTWVIFQPLAWNIGSVHR